MVSCWYLALICKPEALLGIEKIYERGVSDYLVCSLYAYRIWINAMHEFMILLERFYSWERFDEIEAL